MIWWPARKRSAIETAVEAEPTVELPKEFTGPAHLVHDEVSLTSYVAGDPETEKAKLATALDAVEAFLAELGLLAPEHAAVFRTQVAILRDVTWIRVANAEIEKGSPAPMAVKAGLGDISELFDSVTNSTLKERGTDVRSMSRLTQLALVGQPLRRPQGPARAVWIVPELDAATAMQLTPENCAGVVAISELVSGHGIEIATANGFACITGKGDADEIPEGELVTFG